MKLSAWTFSLFTDPFDAWIWLNLILAFLSLTSVILIQAGSRDAFKIIMLIISASLNSEARPLPTRSKLFILWMLYSMLVVNFYSASITSTLIKPPADDIIKTWNDLQSRNFTLYIGLEHHDSLCRHEARQSKILEKFLQNPILVPLSDFRQFMLENMFRDGLFSINSVVGAINVATSLEATIQTQAQTKKEKARKCMIGQELLFSTHILFGFLPPDNEQLFLAFQRILEAGIVDLFTQEHIGMLVSRRVQDRLHVLTKIMRQAKEETTVEKLKLQGKVVTVFLLWILCNFICLTFFCGEHICIRL